jgi:hypothetical protein
MNKIIVIAILMGSFSSMAQTSVFDKYDGKDEVTTIVVNQKMFELMAKFGGSSSEAKEYAEMVGGLSSLKVFTTENLALASDMEKTVNSYLKSSKLTELMRINDDDAQVKIYIVEGKDEDHVKELLMFVNGIKNHVNAVEGHSAEAVIISLTGDIDLNRIAELTEEMNISGSEHLKNAKKK